MVMMCMLNFFVCCFVCDLVCVVFVCWCVVCELLNFWEIVLLDVLEIDVCWIVGDGCVVCVCEVLCMICVCVWM